VHRRRKAKEHPSTPHVQEKALACRIYTIASGTCIHLEIGQGFIDHVDVIAMRLRVYAIMYWNPKEMMKSLLHFIRGANVTFS
jgi:hypothetical protein